MDKSEYRPSRANPSVPSRIRKVVLKKPKIGFPPLFRVKYTPSSLYVRQEVKDDLLNNNIKDCVFEAVEVTPYS